MSDASVVADNGVDWELLPHNWWRESFNAVSWTYPPPHRVRRRSSALSPSIALSSPSSSQFKPLPLRDTLSRSSPNALELSVCCERCQELRHRLCPCSSGGIGPSADLKSSLVGVGIAEDAVEAYEASAGFGERTMDEPDVTELTRRVMALQRHTGTDGLVEHRDAWRSQLHDVFPDARFTCSTGLPLPPPDDAAHLAPILDLDLKSITEIEPHPSTPRPTPRVATSIKEQVDQVLRKFERLHGDWQDEDAKVTPREPPSPSTASSSPATSDDLQSLVSFGTSRTRSSSLPSVNLRKDEHGFYNPVESDSDAAAPALFGTGSPRGRKPAFSKVRARAVARRHGKPQALNDDTDEDDARQTFTVSRLFQRSNDGWIRFVDDDTDKPMVALRPPQTPSDDADIDEPWPSLTPAPGIASAPKPKPPQPKHARRASASAEGWIEPSPVASFSGQRKQRSRSQQFAPPANRGQYGFPPPPPPPPPAPVMQPGYFMYAPMQPAPQTFMPVPYSYAPYGMAPPQIIPYGQFGVGAPTMYRANGWL